MTRAIVLSIGSELLRGDIVDTNAAFLTRELSQLGIPVRRVQQIGDEVSELTAGFSAAIEDAEIVVATGGLGPTQDDLTRDAIAAAVGEEMFTDGDLVEQVEARFASLRRHMPESNLRQALRISSATAIPNPNGTAPGWYVEKDGHVVVAMPGPPQEMQPMWTDQVRPRLSGLLAQATETRALMTFGVGESTVEHRLDRIIGARPDVIVATYAKSTGVEVHITAHAQDRHTARGLVEDTEAAVRDRLGAAVFGTGSDTLASVVGDRLRQRGLSLAVMESATGGELASLITNVEGSSDYFLGGIVAYTRGVKEAHGVPASLIDEHGTISAEVALSMADGARREFGADVAIGVTGIAGRDEVEGRPAGTAFVAVCMRAVREVREIHRPAKREVAKHFFAQTALDLLRRQLG